MEREPLTRKQLLNVLASKNKSPNWVTWLRPALDLAHNEFIEIKNGYFMSLVQRVMSKEDFVEKMALRNPVIAASHDLAAEFFQLKQNIIVGAAHRIRILLSEIEEPPLFNPDESQIKTRSTRLFSAYTAIYAFALAARSHIAQITQAYNQELAFIQQLEPFKVGDSQLIDALDEFLRDHRVILDSVAASLFVCSSGPEVIQEARDALDSFSTLDSQDELQKLHHVICDQIKTRHGHRNHRYKDDRVAKHTSTINSILFPKNSASLLSWEALLPLSVAIRDLMATEANIYRSIAVAYLASSASARVTDQLAVNLTKARMSLPALLSVALGLPIDSVTNNLSLALMADPKSDNFTHSFEKAVHNAHKTMPVLQARFRQELDMWLYQTQYGADFENCFSDAINAFIQPVLFQTMQVDLLEEGQHVGALMAEMTLDDTQNSEVIKATIRSLGYLKKNYSSGECSIEGILSNPLLELRCNMLIHRQKIRLLRRFEKYPDLPAKVLEKVNLLSDGPIEIQGINYNTLGNRMVIDALLECLDSPVSNKATKNFLAETYKLQLLLRLPEEAADNKMPTLSYEIQYGEHAKYLTKNSRIRQLIHDVSGDCREREDLAARVAQMDDIPVAWYSEELDNNEFYWSDLEGLAVRNKDGIHLGTVNRLFETGANDVLLVQGEREYAIPYLPERVILNIDLQTQIIDVDWDANF